MLPFPVGTKQPLRTKPLFHQAELSPRGRLREGLVSLLLFEIGPWLYDYVNPSQTFTTTSSVGHTNSTQGGTINANGDGGYLTLGAPVPTPNNWTASASIYFFGEVPSAASVAATDGSNNVYFYIQGASESAPGALSVNGSNVQVGTWLAQNYSGFHRVTVTGNSSTADFYFDGVSQGTSTINIATTQFANFLGDSVSAPYDNTPYADFFLWNRALSAEEVAYHSQDPYNTVLRPRFPTVNSGVGGLAICRAKPGLMTLGVGP